MASSEYGSLKLVDPAELMRDNPAALIVNQKSYDLMAGYFAPDQMDPPQVLRVATFSAGQGETTRLFVKDGMTRTKYANDHRDDILPEYPDFRFAPIGVRDVTESELRNQLVVPLAEKHENQQALTMLQYLRSVVPPTVEHSAIAPDRIAAHLINGWENMVGSDLAARYPALAAISLLDNTTIPVATELMLRKYLVEQERLIDGETREERNNLQNGLVEMASIMRQTRLLRRKIAESAFVLVSARSEVIGGEKQSLQQIFGLLNTVDASKKLELEYPKLSDREKAKIEFGSSMIQALSQLPQEVDRSKALSLLNQSLRNPDLTYRQIYEIFSSQSPIERFEQVGLEVHISKLRTLYGRLEKKAEFTPQEEQLITNLGAVPNLPDDRLRRLPRFVKAASNALQAIEVLRSDLEHRREELLSDGVSTRTLQSILDELDPLTKELITATSPTTLANNIKKVATKLADGKSTIQLQIDRHAIGVITDEEYGIELQTGQGALVRGNIVACILREVRSSDEWKVRNTITSLRALDQDLQLLVIRGDMRLKVACQRQSSRRMTPSVQASSTLDKELMQEPLEQSTQSSKIEAIEIVYLSLSDEVLTSQEKILQSIEQKRIETNNQRLAIGVDGLRKTLELIDLDKDDMTPENASAISQLLRNMGRFLFDHPDIVRVIEDHPRLLQEIADLRTSKVIQEQSDTIRETKTKI